MSATARPLRLLRRHRASRRRSRSRTARARRRCATGSARTPTFLDTMQARLVEQPTSRRWRGLTTRDADDSVDRAARRLGDASPTCSPSTRSASPTRATCAPRPSAARCSSWRGSSATGCARASPPSVYLAFTLDPSGHARSSSPPGRRVQSVPGPGELPQTVRDERAADAHAGAGTRCRPQAHPTAVITRGHAEAVRSPAIATGSAEGRRAARRPRRRPQTAS